MKKKKINKEKKTSSVLSRQKPRRSRRNQSKTHVLRRIVLGVAVTATLAVTAAGAYTAYKSFQKPDDLKPDWQISLRVTAGEPLLKHEAETAIATAQRLLGRGSLQELEAAARAVQRQGAYARTGVIRLEKSKVALSIARRAPLLFIEADRLRYLADNGAVYGYVGDVGPDQNSLPILRGIFQERSGHFRLKDDRSLEVSDEEAERIREALDLFKLTTTDNYKIGSLEFDRYRGFTVDMAEGETEITFGRAPFEPKLSKLRKILTQLAKKGSQASRIELDYQGKAFVKKRKL